MSEYPEYARLQELRAEDRARRRALASDPYPDFKRRVVLGFDGTPSGHIGAAYPEGKHLMFVDLMQVRPLPRAARRARGRRISRAHAFVRRSERQRSNHRRAQRPVIKKGLTR